MSTTCRLIQKIIIDSTSNDVVNDCILFGNTGADALFITEVSNTDAEHEKNIDLVKEIVTNCDIPVIMGGNIKRLEDVKKYLYAGSEIVVLDMSKESNIEMVKEAADRFGKEKIAILCNAYTSYDIISKAIVDGASYVIKSDVDDNDKNIDAKIIYSSYGEDSSFIKNTFNDNIYGYLFENIKDYTAFKTTLKNECINVKVYTTSVAFSDLKTNSDGMVPVIVQDYKTNEVLMLAYMNEESFNKTIETGRMTYFSRSRNELWEKGLTSGHFQYVKSLDIDCDKDTILAKVYQVGAACHTGKKSCFYTNVYKTDYKDNNPHKVFEDVYNVILDRKENPKEGSYTNYLFDKGIDKILKKVGEEATEIIIAAKNPNKEEIKYEISDFLYHVMVLMAEKGVSWEDITTELSRR